MNVEKNYGLDKRKGWSMSIKNEYKSDYRERSYNYRTELWLNFHLVWLGYSQRGKNKKLREQGTKMVERRKKNKVSNLKEKTLTKFWKVQETKRQNKRPKERKQINSGKNVKTAGKQEERNKNPRQKDRNRNKSFPKSDRAGKVSQKRREKREKVHEITKMEWEWRNIRSGLCGKDLHAKKNCGDDDTRKERKVER